MSEQLSLHFHSRELRCKGTNCCGGAYPIDPRLLRALETLRALVNEWFWNFRPGERRDVPLVINSGYRCPTHNKRINGSPMSQHCRGRAADVRCPRDLPFEKFVAMVETVPEFRDGGVGVYKADNFVHCDVREVPARWNG